MKTKVSKDGIKLVTTEFDVRGIDEHGDSQESFHFDTKQQAVEFAKAQSDYPAYVVEKHISRYPSHLFKTPSEYVAVITLGKEDALRNGGWI